MPHQTHLAAKGSVYCRGVVKKKKHKLNNLGVAAERILQQQGQFTVAVWHDLALLLARQRREHFAERREGRVDVLGLIQYIHIYIYIVDNNDRKVLMFMA
jgi:hypothetical protein